MRVRNRCRIGSRIAVNAGPGGSPLFQPRSLEDRPLQMLSMKRLTGGRKYRCSGSAWRAAANSSFWFRCRDATGSA